MIYETVVGIALNLGIPALGLALFLRLRRSNSLLLLSTPLFIVFFVYGGCLMVVVTSLFWVWSGMASIGTAFLIIAAPIIMSIQAMKLRKDRNSSSAHRWIFGLSAVYPALIGIILLTAYAVNKEMPIKALDTMSTRCARSHVSV